MKKKYRDIVVGGEKYAWRAQEDDDYPSRVKIWKDKKVIFESALSEVDQVTPKIVADIISVLEGHNEKQSQEEYNEAQRRNDPSGMGFYCGF